MTFEEIIDQAVAMLQRRGRVSYRVLARQLSLDEASLEDLKEAILFAHPQVVDEEGRGLIWPGEAAQSGAAPAKAGAGEAAQSSAVPPSDPGAPRPGAEAVTPGAEAERRQLTVLFCDLVDSTVLSSRLDPEELRELVQAYQKACSEVIARFEGHIAQLLGDGLLVYFGYPLAHEDDARRAVRASLGIFEALAQLNARLLRRQSTRLSVRLGIHTGLCVVGNMGGGDRQEQLAMGETPNLAARLQGLATPDTLVISAATYHLLGGLFTCRSLGSPPLKGIARPMEVYQVLHERAATGSLHLPGGAGSVALVGREQELGLLLQCWEQVKDGAGQVVLLGGEAGIGKSHLVQTLVDQALHGSPAWPMLCQCSHHHRNSAFFPIIDLLERAVLRDGREQTPQQKLDKLEELLRHVGLPLAEVMPLFASFLALPPPPGYAALQLSPQQQKQKTTKALLAMLLQLAADKPVLFIVEDLHWADPSTLELLHLFSDQCATARLLLLVTFRPEFDLPWADHSYLTRITLRRLTRPQTMAIIGRVAHGKALPAEVVEQVVAKTDGVPLFVEELTKMVLESGLLAEREDRYELTGPLPSLAIPATLHDSLMARLDRLAAAKGMAQLGATLGREFFYELLLAVSLWDEETLQQGLRQMVEAEFLYQRGVPPHAIYLFKHALVQETAYQSLLRSTRQRHHQRIATVLSERYPEICDSQPELLAHHYTEGSLMAQAIPVWQRAGKLAIERSAHLEASAHFSKGLEVLRALPDASGQEPRELGLQIDLGQALMAARGQGVPEVQRAFARARELCLEVGETAELFPVLWGLWRFYFARAEHRTARELAEQCLSVAQRGNDPALLLVAHNALGISEYFRGGFTAAQAHLEQAIALYDPEQHRALAFRYGVDLGAWSLSYTAWTLWQLGHPEASLQRMNEALVLARRLGHPLSLVATLGYAAMLHYFRREGAAVKELADATIKLAGEQGFPQFMAMALPTRGWALAGQGQVQEGIAQIEKGMAAMQDAGAALDRPRMLAALGEVQGRSGHLEEGLTALAEGIATAQRTEETWWEVELHRLQGELLSRKQSPPEEAEACFRQALETAHLQQARALELRAAVSLSRSWWGRGRQSEARELLAEIYARFTEGFDTVDLQAARALLQEMSGETSLGRSPGSSAGRTSRTP
jgi:class 3 adenylate cyclase/predicted ATPase